MSKANNNIINDLCKAIFGEGAVWQRDKYSGRGFSLAEAPEIPSAAGLPMPHVGRMIKDFLESIGLTGVIVRMRDRIAGDGEPVADIIISEESHRKLSAGKIALGIFGDRGQGR